MPNAPSLLSLCTKAITAALTHGCDYVEEIVELPSDILDGLVANLPPLALQSLHEALFGSVVGGLKNCSNNNRGRKRGRFENFNAAWEVLVRARWSVAVKSNETSEHMTADDYIGKGNLVNCMIDWQQQYWEKHLQECLDGAAETALLPSFYGNVGELKISGSIMDVICHNEDMANQYWRLSYHCSRFGCYARCLRLQNVLCSAEMSELLQSSKLEKLMFVRIISKSQIDGACMLLGHHARTLLSLEFIHCQLYPSVMDQICSSICKKGSVNHGIQHFSIKSSRISESKSSTISAGLLSFLSSARSLRFLCFHDSKMQPQFAKTIIDTLWGASCNLGTLEISENNISGWLSKIDRNSTYFSSQSELCVPMNSLAVLNLRGNNMHRNDAGDLCYILERMPNLRGLDISDNPITDEGIRLLIPFFARALQKENPLAKLKIENCNLSSNGVTKLVECLQSVKRPLDMLSIANNHLGSSIAATLAKFLGSSHVKQLNIEDIGLGAFGFQVLEEQMPRDIALSRVNISKNRGGIRTAHLLSKLIQQAPNLMSVDAGANILPPESLDVICNSLRQTECRLEQLDLGGNTQLCASDFSALLEFKNHGGQPIVVIPAQAVLPNPYDDDP